MMANEMRWGVARFFLVDDVVATAHFYRDKLGFHYDRFGVSRHVFAWSVGAGSLSCSARWLRQE